MSRSPRVSPEDVEAAVLAAVGRVPPGKTVDPTEIARTLGGDHPDGWGPLMKPVRGAAVKLMKEGRVVILRKGRPVDPDDFRGIYRLALPPVGSQRGPGNSSGV
jgi:hypothetical protein